MDIFSSLIPIFSFFFFFSYFFFHLQNKTRTFTFFEEDPIFFKQLDILDKKINSKESALKVILWIILGIIILKLGIEAHNLVSYVYDMLRLIVKISSIHSQNLLLLNRNGAILYHDQIHHYFFVLENYLSLLNQKLKLYEDFNHLERKVVDILLFSHGCPEEDFIISIRSFKDCLFFRDFIFDKNSSLKEYFMNNIKDSVDDL